MKYKITLATMCFLYFFLGYWDFSFSQTTPEIKMEQKEIEDYLKKAQVCPGKQRVGRRTEAWLLCLTDGKVERRGFFRVTNRTRPHPIPDSYKYDLAAYELNKFLDLNIVPPTVEREVEGRKGSLALLIEKAITEEARRNNNIEPPDSERFKDSLEELTVFENLTYSNSYCAERDLPDILIIRKENWKIWRVDFSEAFDPYPELIPECHITRCSKKLYQNLLKLDDEIIKTKLSLYLNDAEISALLERKKIIIEKIKKLIAEKGEEAVLFS
ncbi:MAG: hypothetical protein GTO17_03660 [Candidatus Aminicenantes bacterium]|nr:hypothetical protein [Candidatus Aminicenantes bacterium]